MSVCLCVHLSVFDEWTQTNDLFGWFSLLVIIRPNPLTAAAAQCFWLAHHNHWSMWGGGASRGGTSTGGGRGRGGKGPGGGGAWAGKDRARGGTDGEGPTGALCIGFTLVSNDDDSYNVCLEKYPKMFEGREKSITHFLNNITIPFC
jgi:hypothetical protein